ncbi:hypothetical protein LJR039_007206 [Pseudorhodoferax sp. LjRoot39]|uniref:hypothetical protein n=1 Tax=Pseudorhodoferax sp. LjRoot39 TaxID=3342328 RepID=UPI003ECF1A9A
MLANAMRMSARQWLLAAVFLPVVAWAVVVTAEQIAAAVRASPTASQWLRDNAAAVANLAVRVESSGETTAYNGSCCYGVLQMNRTNIRAYTSLTPEQYRTADLQTQINAWVRLTDDALRAAAPSALTGMATFDGRVVDGNLVLACVQLGIGNCQTMLDSGRCNGFADRNGTTICSMADRLAGTTTPTTPGTGGGTTPGTGAGTGTAISVYTPPCVRDGAGNCLSITAALEQGFEQGSGTTMSNVKSTIYAIVAALVLMVMMASTAGLWKQYARGRMPTVNLILNVKSVLMVVMLALAILTFI